MNLHEVVCGACQRRHVMSAARAREQRVVRCGCGQFVRLDRGLAEAEPAADLADADYEEATKMVSSLEEVEGAAQAFGLTKPPSSTPPPSPKRNPQPELEDADDDEATRMVSSPLKLSSLLPQPPKGEGAPATTGPSKPVWFVDLGGAGTIEMTIDQLIMARRSGKIGESALVWRPGMARWRPVGTLIAAAGAGTSRPGPEPRSKPLNAKITLPPPALPSSPAASRRENSDPSLAVYERPPATLEFALESGRTAPADGPERRSSQRSGPAARDSAPAASTPAVARDANGDERRRGSKLDAALRRRGSTFITSLPKWVAIGAPALVCTVLAIAGALLVRSLRAPRPLPAASSIPAAKAVARVPDVAVPTKPAAIAAPAAAELEPIVDVDSLSLEKRPARPKAAVNRAPKLASQLAELEETKPEAPGEPGADEAVIEAAPAGKPKRAASSQADAGASSEADGAKARMPPLGDSFYNPGF